MKVILKFKNSQIWALFIAQMNIYIANDDIQIVSVSAGDNEQ